MAKKKTDTPEKKAISPLDAAMMSLEKQFGKGIIITGDRNNFTDIEWIPSGSASLDLVLNGGYPRGRIIEIYGPPGSGKTSLALHAIAEMQKKGNTCAFIDAEHALSIDYASSLGVDISNLLVSQPDCGEQALEVANMLTKSGTVGLIVIDSVAALTPRAEIEGKIGDSHVGRQPRLMSQAMRILAGVTQKTNTTIIFINQIRMKVNVMFASPETTSGGEALKFYTSQRLDIRRIGVLDSKEGIRTRIKAVKNKVGPPFKMTELNIIFGKGIDSAMDLLDLAVAENIVEKSGAWYSLGKERLGQGTANAAKFLEENPDMADEIRNKLTRRSSKDDKKEV